MNKADILISEIDKDVAVDFIQRYHYSKILPRLTKHYLGYYYKGDLVGVATLGWGTQPLQTIKKLFPNSGYTTVSYYEIGKMCFRPDMNGTDSFGSMAISLLVSWCKKNTECAFLYTLADGIMGKVGYVYQASNFLYIGKFKTSVYMDATTKEKIHPRSAKSLCLENAEFSGKEKVFWLTHDFCEYKGIEKINGYMFRYIFPLNKQARKDALCITAGSYPKEDSLKFFKRIANGKFTEIEQPHFNMDVFEHNYQKYPQSNTEELQEVA